MAELVVDGSILLSAFLGGIMHFVLSVPLHYLVGVPLGAHAELGSSPTFRSMKDPLMLYPVLIAPFVSSLLCNLLARGLFGAAAVAAWSLSDALRFALALWACSAFHGIFMDWTVFRISWRVVVHWWGGSLVGAFATACAMHYCL